MAKHNFLDLEYSSTIQYPSAPAFGFGRPVCYDSVRLTTAIARESAPPGSDRAICRTVNGIVRLRLIAPVSGWSGIATAALMGVYGGKTAIIQEHTTGPIGIGFETTGLIQGPNPASSRSANLYSVANMSGGAYGFDYFSSYSNLAEEIFIRVQIGTLSVTADGLPPATLEISGVLMAGDPA